MKMRISPRWFLLAIVLLVPALAAAQLVTGSIDGTVRDESGGVLPGATVTLSSPELPGGPQIFITDGQGSYRFRNLPPGTYQLQVEMDSFAPYREEGLRVVLGGNIERNVSLNLGGFADSVTVTGEAPIVDTRKSGLSTNYGDEFMENTPLRRFSMFDFTKTAPGMSATNPTSGSSNRVSAYGSGTDENTYLMDGTDYTAPVSGAAWPWPNTDAIEEIEVISLGASAEFQVGGGAVFNAVTKQGTNSVTADGSLFGMFDALTAKPVKVDCGGCPDGDENGETGFTRDKFVDFTAQVGAPIWQDKMWIYGGYQYQRDYDNQPGTDPRFPRQFEADRINWKYTWQINPNIKFMHTYHDDYWVIPQIPSVSAPFESILTFSGRNPSVTFGNITHILDQNTLYDVRVSGFYSPADTAEPNGNFGQSRREDVGTGEISGGPPFSGGFRQARTAVHGKLSHYASDFIGADHDFKFGVQYVDGSHSGHYGYTNNIIYYDYNGAPDYAYIRERYDYGGKFTDLGFFAEDTVQIAGRATLQIGLRYDRVEALSQDVDRLDQDLNPIGSAPGIGTLYTNNNVAPRIGFNIKLDDEGATVIRGNWGLYYRQPITGELDEVHPGLTPVSLAFFDPGAAPGCAGNPTADCYTDVVFTFDPLTDIRIADDTLSPRTSQLSIGFDRQVTNDIAIGFTYVRKDGSQYNGWSVENSVYGRDTVTLENGQQLEIFPILNDIDDQTRVLGNCPCGPTGAGSSVVGGWPNQDFFLDYDGIQVQMTKRMADNWQAIVAYNYGHVRGLMGNNSLDPGNSQESRVRSTSIGRDPNDFTNAEGNLLNDRTHTVTITGNYEVPNVEVLIGANFRYYTGKPWAQQTSIRDELPQGRRSIYIEPLGSQRLSSQSMLDLRISKIFRFGDTGRIEILADILNTLNSSAEEDLVTRNFADIAQNGVLPNRWVDPRRAMVGVKIAY